MLFDARRGVNISYILYIVRVLYARVIFNYSVYYSYYCCIILIIRIHIRTSVHDSSSMVNNPDTTATSGFGRVQCPLMSSSRIVNIHCACTIIVSYTRPVPNPSNLHRGIIFASSRGNLNIIIFNIPNTYNICLFVIIARYRFMSSFMIIRSRGTRLDCAKRSRQQIMARSRIWIIQNPILKNLLKSN